MLNIQTFDAQAGGNVIYKALAHPLAAEAIARLYAAMAPPVAIYDPDRIADALLAMYPLREMDMVFVHDVSLVGQLRAGRIARALVELPSSGARTVLIAAFDAGRTAARIRPLLPAGAVIATLDAARLPAAMLSVPDRYLDKLNFATNFAFFRDDDRMATRLVSANYWSVTARRPVRLLAATVRRARRPDAGQLGGDAAGEWRRFCTIDGRAVRARFEPRPLHRPVVTARDRCHRPRCREIRCWLPTRPTMGPWPVLHA